MMIRQLGNIYPLRTKGRVRSLSIQNGALVSLCCGVRVGFVRLSERTVNCYVIAPEHNYFNSFVLRPCDGDLLDLAHTAGCVVEVRSITDTILVSIVSTPGIHGEIDLSRVHIAPVSSLLGVAGGY